MDCTCIDYVRLNTLRVPSLALIHEYVSVKCQLSICYCLHVGMSLIDLHRGDRSDPTMQILLAFMHLVSAKPIRIAHT